MERPKYQNSVRIAFITVVAVVMLLGEPLLAKKARNKSAGSSRRSRKTQRVTRSSAGSKASPLPQGPSSLERNQVLQSHQGE
jgi:hypothetical protein